jgi:hypothetical protein
MSLESRLEKLEAVQQAPRRQYTDMERAVRYVYLLEQGGPDADKVRAILAQSEAKQGISHEQP